MTDSRTSNTTAKMNDVTRTSKERTALTYEQKLLAIANRFYNGQKWMVTEGDYYTSSRADLELYRVVKIDEWKVFTEYCTSPGNLSEWDLMTFNTGPGFGQFRVHVPEWIFGIEPVPTVEPLPSASLNEMVDRFLAWPLPKSVCSDLCVTDSNYPSPRSGTNLLTADEARSMLEYVTRATFEPGPGYEEALILIWQKLGQFAPIDTPEPEHLERIEASYHAAADALYKAGKIKVDDQCELVLVQGPTKLPEQPPSASVFDRADALIRDLHASGMVTMQVYRHGARLRIEPEANPNSLTAHLQAMCGWAELLAELQGWTRGNAATFWKSRDAARALAPEDSLHEHGDRDE